MFIIHKIIARLEQFLYDIQHFDPARLHTWDFWILIILPFILSLISIHMINQAGKLNKNAWLIGLFNQGLWLVWILYSDYIGFLLMNIAYWYVYTKNHFRWRKLKT